MPVKLSVSFLLIALCLSVVSEIVPDAEHEMLSDEVMAEAERLRDHISSTYYSSIGDSKTVWMSVPVRGTIVVGGEGIDSHIIRAMVDGEVIGRLFLDNPMVAVIGECILEGDGAVDILRTEKGVTVGR